MYSLFVYYMYNFTTLRTHENNRKSNVRLAIETEIH